MSELPRGLAGVAVDTTRISEIDGQRGTLRYRGYPIEEVVTLPFVDVVGLVLDGELPSAAERQSLTDELARGRTLPAHVGEVLRRLPADTHPMTVLQVALPLCDDPAQKALPVTDARQRQRSILLGLAAKVPTLVASWHHARRGQPLPTPQPELPLHADFLRMLNGTPPAASDVQVLDVTQILQMEHGFNASTFAGRVVASTLCPLSMTLSACVGALYGPLHGGADEAAFRMALAIGKPERAAGWVDAELAAGRKIMGLGHREYRVVDPRAKVLKSLAVSLGERKGMGDLVRTLEAVDDHAAAYFEKQGKAIRANVEFYKGAVFAALGLPPEFFTTLFVMGRIYGWGAHVLELWDDPKLFRPAATYQGAPARSLGAR